MFSNSPRRFDFGNSQEPWFRIGTLDIGSAGVVSLLVIVGMFLLALGGPSDVVTNVLEFSGTEVGRGQVWRLVTWFIPNSISLWTIISAVMIFFLGSRIEGTLGRVRMAKFLLVLILIPSILASLLHAVGLGFRYDVIFGAQLVSSALFYTFVAYMPGVRFFFGIPGWVFALVFFTLEALSYLSTRDVEPLLFLVLRVGGTLMAAKAFGLANSVEWIPDLRKVGISGEERPASPRKRRGRHSKKGVSRPMVAVDSSFEEMGIDEILDQISAFGMDSLNSAQRKKLDAYSKGRKKGS